jgi:hypothetical protein
MASGQETYDTLWTGLNTYKTEFAVTDLASGGFNWRELAELNLSNNFFTLGAGYTLPEYSTVFVLTVDVTIGAILVGPFVSITYTDSVSSTLGTSVQVIQGMQQYTSISVPITATGIINVTAITRTTAVSGTITVHSADSVAEKFDSTSWSAASPGL